METTLIDWLQTPSLLKGVISFLLLISLSFVPFMPIALVYGAIAFAYPLWLALIINVSGSVVGAVLMFWLCKYGLKGYYERKIQYVEKDSKFIKLLMKNPFLAILIGRLIPVLPTAIVNIISAMFQVPTRIYVIATLLGKLPAIFIYSIVGNQLLDQNPFVWLLLAVYLVILAICTKKFQKSWIV